MDTFSNLLWWTISIDSQYHQSTLRLVLPSFQMFCRRQYLSMDIHSTVYVAVNGQQYSCPSSIVKQCTVAESTIVQGVPFSGKNTLDITLFVKQYTVCGVCCPGCVLL